MYNKYEKNNNYCIVESQHFELAINSIYNEREYEINSCVVGARLNLAVQRKIPLIHQRTRNNESSSYILVKDF